MTPPADNAATLPIPTARDIRIRLQPLTAAKSNYYGTPTPPVGIFSDYITRKEATSEAGLFPVNPPNSALRVLPAPVGNLPALMAQSLRTDAERPHLFRPAGPTHRVRRLRRPALHTRAGP